MAFHVGDRVIGRGVMSGVDITGFTGTIVENESSIYDYAVDFDEPRERIENIWGDVAQFHDCYGKAHMYCGFFCGAEVLEPYSDPCENWDGVLGELSDFFM